MGWLILWETTWLPDGSTIDPTGYISHWDLLSLAQIVLTHCPLHRRCICDLKSSIFTFISSMERLKFPRINATRPHWWLVNIGSGNGSVPSGSKPFFTWANVHPLLCYHWASAGHSEWKHIEPRQNGCHFADIFKCIFFKENLCLLITISLKFTPTGAIIINPSLVKIMGWHQTGEKQSPEPMTTTQFGDIDVPLGLIQW